MPLKAVLFDVDDTLLDWRARQQTWEDLEWQHLGQVFDYVHTQVHPLKSRDRFYEDTLAAIIDGWQAAKRTLRAPHLGLMLLETLAAQGAPPDALNMLACLDAYGPEAPPGLRLYPEVPQVLDGLRARGLRLGIITNSIRPMYMRMVEFDALGLWSFFAPDHCLICAADVGYIKPHPAIFQAGLDVLGVRAEEAVFVGDSLKADIAGAQGAGMHAIQRDPTTPPAYTEASLTQAAPIVPDGHINSLDELPAALDALYPPGA